MLQTMQALNWNLDEKKKRVLEMIFIIAMAAVVFFMVTNTFGVAWAAGEDKAQAMVKSVVGVLRVLLNIVGVIFAIVGVAQFMIANAQEDGPQKQKAIMFMATGVILVIAGVAILPNLHAENWIDTNTGL